MPYFLIIRGPLGCGKSTISEKLAQILKAKHFEVDRVLDDHKLFGEEEDGYISQATFIKANDIIVPQALTILKNNQPIIFDGNFYWQSQIDDFIKRLDFPNYVFTLAAPLEVCLARDQARTKTHGYDAAEAVYRKSTSFTCGTEIDVTKNIDECIKEIISYLPKN